VTADEDGQSKVSVGTRKAAPKKKGAMGQRRDDQRKNGDKLADDGGDEGFEEVDPDEPRYCICGDVSYGTMIACSNEDDVSLYGYFITWKVDILTFFSIV
jgi:hypothetical protein